MASLSLLVDYDNVEKGHLRAGPVNLAKMLASLIPSSVLSKHSSVEVRLYGGWMSGGILSRTAQRLVPDIHAHSPSVIRFTNEGVGKNITITISLAYKLLNAHANFEETLVKDRSIRKFRSVSSLSSCINTSGCGLTNYLGVDYSTQCGNSSCSTTLEEMFVRDEQKMVDTMLVADMAQLAIANKASDIVVVSSDIDMWPGVLLALQNGCSVTHIHTKHGWRTQRHLLRTLPSFYKSRYTQLSV